jgi:hypothetical protein
VATLAEVRLGDSWHIVPTPNPAGAAEAGLSGVSCASPTACTAVGTAFDNSGNPLGTLTERWNGASWGIQSTPTSASPGDFLNDISCVSAAQCTAVGNTATDTLAEIWNGVTWRVVPTPDPAGAAVSGLFGVSCTAPSACTAVGAGGPDPFTTFGTVAERWNGTAWSIQPTPTSSDPSYFLSRVSCTTINTCTAVGNTDSGLLAERWDGTSWSVQPTPAPPGTDGNGDFLNSVTCSTPFACTAVGLAFSHPGFGPQIVAEGWDGKSWSVQATPEPLAYDLDNPAVSCPDPFDCTSVGGYTNDGPKVTLVEQWNGRGSSSESPANTRLAPKFGFITRPAWRTLTVQRRL